jgi:inosose dehydratase
MAAPDIRLGVSPLSWVNEVLADFGAGTPAETVLGEAREAGFEGVELSRVFPREPGRLASLLDGYGLSLVSGWHSGFLADRTVEEEILAVRDHASLLKSCGAEVMVYGECGRMPDNALDLPMSRRGRLSASEWAGYGAKLTAFADALHAGHGLRLAYHHHLMMVAETAEELRAVMDNSGASVGLLLDTGHAYAGGFAYSDLIDAYADRIAHIHLKDVRKDVMAQVRSGDLSFNDGVRAGMFTIPGDGNIDFAPLARFLASGRYKGWVLVEAEQDPAIAQPAMTVKRAFAFASSSLLPAPVV